MVDEGPSANVQVGDISALQEQEPSARGMIVFKRSESLVVLPVAVGIENTRLIG
jgi:hypothetical protein